MVCDFVEERGEGERGRSQVERRRERESREAGWESNHTFKSRPLLARLCGILVCVLILQDLLQSCSRGGGGEWRSKTEEAVRRKGGGGGPREWRMG